MNAERLVQWFEDDEVLEDAISSVVENVEEYVSRYLVKTKVHTTPCTSQQRTEDLLTSHYRVCLDGCRMLPRVFVNLCNTFKEQGLLAPTRNITVEEQMHIFLYALGHGLSNRALQQYFQHPGETISRHINHVLRAMAIWSCDMIKPKDDLNAIPDHILHHHGGKFFPYFKDCIGALDGTHIHACVPKAKQPMYRSGHQPKYTTQNVLGVCDFRMRFIFLSAGWEGSAHDNRVLTHAIYESNCFPMPPPGKYYLVDSGYPNKRGFLAPYRNTRYHFPEFQSSQPQGEEEIFNSMHSSLRNVIDRAFGVLKMRWRMLNMMGPYLLNDQAKFVAAAMSLHNFIIDHNNDPLTLEFDNNTTIPTISNHSGGQPVRGGDNDMSLIHNRIRDEIAASRGL